MEKGEKRNKTKKRRERVVLIFNTASNCTLSIFYKQKLNEHTMGIITIKKLDTMNSNTSKPDILRQLFK
jgi:hypothetical protein